MQTTIPVLADDDVPGVGGDVLTPLIWDDHGDLWSTWSVGVKAFNIIIADMELKRKGVKL